MTPADLLVAARGLLEHDKQSAVGGWPRAVAFLTRQALEQALSDLWAGSRATTGLSECPMKTQLLCLPAYLEPGLAREIGYAWAALSNACHYHPYELAPTAAELSGWMTAVSNLTTSIALAREP
ncbi:MAG TPA: hypothetical protein VFQ44_12145 [Streptosporangiaceae bacterium]|nr:hypothetical protein [Streptosporangiaceae bacterium]